MDDAHAQLKDEKARRVVVIQTLAIVEKRIKSIEVVAEKQTEDQHLQLHKAEEQLAVAKEQIEAQKKEMEEVEEAAARAEQNGYDIGIKETKDILRAQVTRVCRDYCHQVWTKALNLAEVGASSELRRIEYIFYPPALRVAVQPCSQVVTTPKVPEPAQPAYASTFPTTLETSKESKRVSTKGKEKRAAKHTVPEKTTNAQRGFSGERGSPKQSA